MKLSDIFKQQKIASGETAIPEQFQTTGSDATKCRCDLSSQDVSDLSDVFNAMVPDSKPNCAYCGHSAEEHQPYGCGSGTLASIKSRVPLETTYLPHDGELGSARVLADALQSSGLSSSHSDHMNILTRMGKLEGTGPDSEERRQFHKAVFSTIQRLMTTGRLPSDDHSGSATGLFKERAANVTLLQKMAEHHGGDIMGMFDAYRKYSGTTLGELGIGKNEVGKKYSDSQERANQAAQGILSEHTQIMPTMQADDCEPCSRNASTMGRVFQAYLGTMERQHPLGPAAGAQEALEQWHKLEVGHVLGDRLPKGSHAYLLKAQSTLDDWRDSGHLYGDAHSRPDSMYFSRMPTVLEGPEPGSGESHSPWFDRIYNANVNGSSANSAYVPRNKRDETLSSIWSSLIGSHDGTEEDWLSTPGNLKKVTDLEGHLRSIGMGHVADRFIKRETLLEADPTGTHSPGCPGCTSNNQRKVQHEAYTKKALEDYQAANPDKDVKSLYDVPELAHLMTPPNPVRSELHTPMLVDSGRQRLTIDTGGHIITFMPGRRTLEGEQYTLGNVSREIPRQSIKLTTYGEAAPKYSDLERYIFKKGADIDLDALTTTRVNPKKAIACRAKREEHTDQETGETYYTDSAVIPSLVPEDIETGNQPEIQEHVCDQHDGHLFDSDGNITHVLMKNSRDLKPSDKPGMKRLFEQALENIDPFAYSENREDLITNLGAEMARGMAPDSGTTERPRFSPGGSTDLLGTSEQQIRSETPTESQIEGKPPTKRTRKK